MLITILLFWCNTVSLHEMPDDSCPLNVLMNFSKWVVMSMVSCTAYNFSLPAVTA